MIPTRRRPILSGMASQLSKPSSVSTLAVGWLVFLSICRIFNSSPGCSGGRCLQEKLYDFQMRMPGSRSLTHVDGSERETSLKAPTLRTTFKTTNAMDPAEQDVIVVTGGLHNIGRHLVETLLWGPSPILSGPVTLVVLYSTSVPEGDDGEPLFSSSSNDAVVKVILERIDIADYDTVLRGLSPYASRIRGVIHLAAVSRVQDCHQNMQRCEDVNVGGTENIMRALWSFYDDTNSRGSLPWMVFASSREVYGALGRNEIVDETSPLRPLNIYGETKLKAEMAMQRWAHETGVNAVVLRFNNVYGSCYDHGSRLVPIMISKLVSGDQFVITDSGSKTISMVHVQDIVQAIQLGAKHAETLKNSAGVYEAFNIGGGPSHDVHVIKDMYRMAQSAVADLLPECVECRSGPVVRKATSDRSPEPEHFRSYIDKATKVLGYSASQTFNVKTLRKYVETCVLPHHEPRVSQL